MIEAMTTNDLNRAPVKVSLTLVLSPITNELYSPMYLNNVVV